MDDWTYDTNDSIEPRREEKRDKIPVGDNDGSSVITLTVDEESGKRVMVVDKQKFAWLMSAGDGVIVELRNQWNPYEFMSGFNYVGPEWHRANEALSAVMNAIKGDDTMVVFK